MSKDYIDENIEELLKTWGSSINFNDDVWLCDIASDYPNLDYRKKITFTCIDKQYRELVKYYVILCEQRLATVQTNVYNINKFLRYLVVNENNIELKKINSNLIQRYRNYLENNENLKKITKSKYMSCISDFFQRLNGWDEVPKNNPVNRRYHLVKRNKADNEIKTKYIPDDVFDKLNKIFKNEKIPVHFRLYYCLCALYPTRSSELLNMRIDSIKPFKDKYVYFKTENKSRNTYGDTNLIQVYINYEGMGKILVDLFYEQREVAISLRDEVKDEFKDLLFIYRPINNGTIYKKPSILNGPKFNRFMKQICREEGIDTELSDIGNITSHRFRHNCITDRIYEGFSTTAIKDLSGQLYDSTIYDSYFYRREDKGKIIQRKSLKNRFEVNKKGVIEKCTKEESEYDKAKEVNSFPNFKVMFRGRIMNLEEGKEKRLLANKRAYKISHNSKCIGICTDIYSCESKLFNCLVCENFAPDLKEINYFEEQVEFWREREEELEIKKQVFQYEKAKQIRKKFEDITMKLIKIKVETKGE